MGKVGLLKPQEAKWRQTANANDGELGDVSGNSCSNWTEQRTFPFLCPPEHYGLAGKNLPPQLSSLRLFLSLFFLAALHLCGTINN